MRKHKFISLFLAILMLLSVCPQFSVSVFAEAYTGNCGENLTYSFDSETGVLTISGEGSMTDYDYFNDVPWYSYTDDIIAVVVENGVTNIGARAFVDCAGLLSVEFPESLLSIGMGSFKNCSSLDALELPEGLIEIGDSAFCECDSLTSIKIPDSVEYIGSEAFYSCEALSSIEFPSSVSNKEEEYSYYMEGYIFSECDSLSTIFLPQGLTHIRYGTFSYCNALTVICIPDSVEYIEDHAFDGCDALTTVFYSGSPSQWEEIECYDSGNEVLLNATIYFAKSDTCEHTPDSSYIKEPTCTQLGFTVSHCADCGETYYHSPVASKGHTDSDNDCICEVCGANTILSYEIVDGCVEITGVKSSFKGGDIIIPENIEGYPVTKLFLPDYGVASIENVIIPKTVTTFEYMALSVEKFIVDEDNEYFYSDENGVIFSKDKTSLIRFPVKSDITEYTVPETVTSIADFAFSFGINLSFVCLPDNLKSIGEAAFAFCASLKAVDFPETLMYVDAMAFWECSLLNKLEFPEGVTSVCDCGSFYALEKVSVPSTVDCVDGMSFVSINGAIELYFYNPELDFTGIFIVAVTTADGMPSNKEAAEMLAEQNILNVRANIFGDTLSQEEMDRGEEIVNYFESIEILDGSENVTIHGYADSTAEIYANENGFKFVEIVDCEHSYSSVVTLPNCTEQGYTTYTCSLCADSYVADFTDAQHSFGDWTVTAKPTFSEAGEKVRTCTACTEKETEILAKLEAFEEYTNTETGIGIITSDNSYNGDISVEISEIKDDFYFQTIAVGVGNVEMTIFDISTMLNGEKVQPETVVLVKMPVPYGYNPDTILIYYVSDNGTVLQKMNSYTEDGYIYFETDHFSKYAVVDTSKTLDNETNDINCSCNCHSNSKFISFFHKIAVFFWKLFGCTDKRYCACGAAHW